MPTQQPRPMAATAVLVLALVFLSVGIGVIILDQVELPALSDNELTSVPSLFIERFGKAGQFEGPYGLHLQVVLMDNRVRYGIDAPEATYELSTPTGTVDGIHAVCAGNRAASAHIDDGQGHTTEWRLTNKCSLPAQSVGAWRAFTDVDSNIDFWWDQPRDAYLDGLGSWFQVIDARSSASAVHAELSQATRQLIQVIGPASISFYLHAKYNVFGSPSGNSHSRHFFTLPEDLRVPSPQVVHTQLRWASLITSDAPAVAFLGAGALLGSVPWSRIRSESSEGQAEVLTPPS